MKKLSWLLCLMAMLVAVPVSSAFAESAASYESDAGVGFYGKYVYPRESSPDSPSENGGDGGIDSSTGGNESSPGSGAPSESGKTTPTLPQTGDSASSQATLIGLLFISSAFLFIHTRKQRTI